MVKPAAGDLNTVIAVGDSVAVTIPVCDLLGAADATACLVSQLLFGETASVLEVQLPYLRVQNSRDAYEGYLRLENVRKSTVGLSADYLVNQRATLLFNTPDIKQPAALRLVFGSQVRRHESDEAVGSSEANGNGQMLQTADGYYVWRDHVSPSDTVLMADPVEFALRYCLAAPYLWGGRSPDGFDCSGLVQMAQLATGRVLPRDSHQQEAALANKIDLEERQRGDLVFWPGHVGLLVNRDELLHATAHSLKSLVEPFEAVCSRAGPISSIRRPG